VERSTIATSHSSGRVRVVGLGAGGHARVVMEVLSSKSEMVIVGLLDANPELQGQWLGGAPVLGSDEQLPLLRSQGVTHFFVGVGSTANLLPRRRLYEMALAQGLRPVTALHSMAWVSPSATIGAGGTILAAAIVSAGSIVEDNVIINSGAIVEHDCVIAGHVHIATGAILAGGVAVGSLTHIGAGAVVRQGIRIGSGVVVGVGAVVVKDVGDGQKVVGNPARAL